MKNDSASRRSGGAARSRRRPPRTATARGPRRGRGEAGARYPTRTPQLLEGALDRLDRRPRASPPRAPASRPTSDRHRLVDEREVARRAGQQLLELPEDHLGARRPAGGQRLELDRQDARPGVRDRRPRRAARRPPESARAALTASAIASRVRSGAPPEGPSERARRVAEVPRLREAGRRLARALARTSPRRRGGRTRAAARPTRGKEASSRECLNPQRSPC